MKRKFTSVGMLFMMLMLALASLGVAFGLWSKVLTIEGTVHTGEVNAELSIEEIDEGVGSQLSDNGINEDEEFEGKDIVECSAELLDGLPNPGPQLMKVTVTSGYPSFECYINWNVENTGTIPIKLHLPNIVSIDPGLDVHFETPIHGAGSCYFNEVGGSWDGGTPDPHPQLEPQEMTYCTLHLHVLQSAQQGATLTFKAEILAHQWNEEP